MCRLVSFKERIVVSNKLASLVYNLFVRTVGLSKNRWTLPLWRWTWEKSSHLFSSPVHTTIHGYKVIVNYGYTYPLNARKFPSLNNPLIELVYQAYCAKKKPIALIDAGAAVGDTILLLQRNCSGMIERFYCVEGDEEFFGYLRNNLRSFKEGELIFAVLSDSESVERELVRSHLGTASAQGEARVPACTLSSIVKQAELNEVDVLKLDIDGLDGKVLAGAKTFLKNLCPAVIFEWHPILYQKTNNRWAEPFDVLLEAGYENFIWFDKYGAFSHFMFRFGPKNLEHLAELCLRNRHDSDWHYDVAALHRASVIDPVQLAELSFAKAKKSKF